MASFRKDQPVLREPGKCFPKLTLVPTALQTEIIRKFGALDFVHFYKASRCFHRFLRPRDYNFAIDGYLRINCDGLKQITISTKTRIETCQFEKDSEIKDIATYRLLFYFSFSALDIFISMSTYILKNSTAHYLNDLFHENKVICDTLFVRNLPVLEKVIDILKPTAIDLLICQNTPLPGNLKTVGTVRLVGQVSSYFAISFFNKYAENLQKVHLSWSESNSVGGEVVETFYRLVGRILKSSNKKCEIYFDAQIKSDRTMRNNFYKPILQKRFEHVISFGTTALIFPSQDGGSKHFVLFRKEKGSVTAYNFLTVTTTYTNYSFALACVSSIGELLAVYRNMVYDGLPMDDLKKKLYNSKCYCALAQIFDK